VYPQMYWAEVRKILWTGCQHITGITEISRHTLQDKSDVLVSINVDLVEVHCLDIYI